MNVLLVTHESCMEHDAGWGHPERPARLEAVIRGVVDSGLDVTRVVAPRVERETLTAVHDPDYVDAIERLCRRGGAVLDPDTRVVPESWEAVLRSAGGGPEAIVRLRRREGDVAFVATRPPGHHALRAKAMGFCIFNNIAVSARAITAAGERVAIVDWDVHHGNGTQRTFYEDGAVLYVSLHQDRFYPGTGALTERGAGAGLGTTVNLPLPAGTGGAEYVWLMREVVLPRIDAFGPDWLLVSSGYDAHRDDPLANMGLQASDYGAMARLLVGTVESGRTVFFLEGGYDLDALRDSAAATLRGHARITDAPPAVGFGDGSPGWRRARSLIEAFNGQGGQEGADQADISR